MKKYQKTTQIIFLLAILLISLISPLQSAQAQSTEVLPSGLPVSQLATAIEDHVQENQATTAGMAVGVFDGDEILYENYFGFANKAENLHVDADTVFEWGSVTKLITWVSVMQVWEQGLLDLNADIRTYLPDTLLSDLKYDEPITMIHLMNHTPGFEEVYKNIFANEADSAKNLETLLVESEPRQIFPPGELTAYSNWGATLAGYIVERVSGQNFADYVNTHIFKALDMNHTSIFPGMSDNTWVQAQRKNVNCYTAKLSPVECDFVVPMYPAGSATGTLKDLATFAQALVPGSKKASRLFQNPATFETLYSATDVFPKSGLAKNCHGFWVGYYDVIVYGHGGNTAGMSSKLQLDPVSGIGIVVMTNQTQEQAYTADMEKIIFGQENVHKHGMPERELVGGIFKPFRAVEHGPLRIAGVQFMAMDNEMLSQAWEQDTVDGKTVIRHPIFDLKKIGTAELIIVLLSIVAIVLGGLVSLTILIVMGIRALVKRNKKQEMPDEFEDLQPLRKWRLTGLLMQLFVLLVFLGFFACLLTFSLSWQVIVVSVLALLVLIGLVLHLIRFMSLPPVLKTYPKERFKTILLFLVNVLAIVAIFYFQSYQFWALL